MSILSIALFIIPALAGTSVVAAARLFNEKIVTVLVGTTLGTATVTTLLYIVISLGQPHPALLLGSLTVIAAATAVLIPAAWRHWRVLPLDRIAVILLVTTGILFSIIAPKLLIEKSDGLYTGIVNAYGDVAWHAANITMFAEGQTIPPENPIFAGTRLSYPFMINVHSGLLLIAGATLPESVTWPALIFIPLLLTLLYCFIRDISQRKSIALISLLLFLFGGATLGWLRLPADVRTTGTPLLQFLTHLPQQDYSGVGTDTRGYHFLNPVTSLLLPQRSLLVGFPLAFSILLLLMAPRRTLGHYLVAGIASGLLPLWHGHTVVALLPVIVGLALTEIYRARENRMPVIKNWLTYALVSLTVGIPEILYYLVGDSEDGSFFRWSPRWMAGKDNLLWYWFKNTGFLIPAAIAGLLHKRAPEALKLLAISGGILFVVANLWLFAPWAWDNFKLFVYFFIFTLPLVSWLAVQLWQRRQRVVQIVIIIILANQMLSAALDIWKISLPTATTWMEWSADDVAFAQHIQQVTAPGDSIVTAANHNSAVVLAGRPRYLGYAAHVWSHGGNPWNREKALPAFYQGHVSSLPETAPEYALVSPPEQATFTVQIPPTWQLVAQAPKYQLYRLPTPPAPASR